MPSEYFEQKLREKVSEARRVPSPQVWQAIEAELASQPSRRKPLLWWWLGASALLGAVLLGGWLLWPQAPPPAQRPPVPHAERMDQQPVPAAAPTTTLPAAAVAEPASAASSAAPARRSPRLKPLPAAVADLPMADLPVAAAAELAPAATPPRHPSLAEVQALSPHPYHLAVTAADQPDGAAACQELPAPSPRRWSLRFSLQAEQAGRGALRSLLQAPGVDHSLLETDPLLISPREGNVYTLQYPRQSLALNLGLGWQLRPRWELMSGVALLFSETGRLQRGTVDLTTLPADGTRAEEAVQAYNLRMLWRQHQVEIPLLLRYEALRRGRHRLSLVFGASANRIWTPLQSFDLQPAAADPQPSLQPDPLFDSSARSFTTPDAQTLLRFRRWHAHLDARAWYAYQLTPQWQLYAGPTLKSHLSGAYEGLAARDQMRYRVGLELGLRFGQ